MDVGRPRKDGNPLKLEKRVYPHHGQFIYRHKDGRSEPLGKDIAKANARAKIYNDPDGRYGTVGYFIDLYIADARAGRTLRKKKPRTIEDYDVQAPFLRAALGAYLPGQLVDHPELIAEYRDNRTAKVRANRELSLLSATFTWLIQKGYSPGLLANPVNAIERNPEKAKARYVEDAEYNAAYSIAVRPVAQAMTLSYLTLQRPSDLLALTPGAVATKTVGGTARHVLTITQGKTGRTVHIELTAELEAALRMLTRDGDELGRQRLSESITRIVPTVVHATDGSAYTEDGMRAMIRRYCEKSTHRPFGLMDVRAKGATDAYLRGVPLEHIQMLMGHKSITTTEIYIKQLLATVRVASPNTRRAAGE